MRLLFIYGLLLGTLCGLSSCKARHTANSNTQNIFRDDTGPNGWRRTYPEIQPADYPFILAMETGCTGYILDRDAGIAVSAEHCSIGLTDHVCGLAPHSIKRVSTDEDTRRTKRLFSKQDCPAEGVITEILESSNLGDYDYVIFKFKLFEPGSARLLDNAKISHDAGKFRSLIAPSPNSQTEWVYLTGYPADPHASSQLSESRCHVRSDLLHTPYQKGRQEVWAKLTNAWRNHADFRKDPVEFNQMRVCAKRIPNGKAQRFHYDCSVYGGNSGGPLYYMDRRLGMAVVVGMPETYIPKRSASQTASKREFGCYERYLDKYFRPFLSDSEMQTIDLKSGSSGSAAPSGPDPFDQFDRNGPVQSLPEASPMIEMVNQSQWLKGHRQYLLQGEQEEINKSIDNASAISDTSNLDSLGIPQ